MSGGTSEPASGCNPPGAWFKVSTFAKPTPVRRLKNFETKQTIRNVEYGEAKTGR